MSVLGRLGEGTLREADGAGRDERAGDVKRAHGNLKYREERNWRVSEPPDIVIGLRGRPPPRPPGKNICWARLTLKPSPSLPSKFSFGTTTLSSNGEREAGSANLAESSQDD